MLTFVSCGWFYFGSVMRRKKIYVVFILVFSILLSTFGFYTYQLIQTPNILVEKEDRVLLIPYGATFKDVQNKLYDEDYVQDLITFSFLAKLMDYDKKVKAGRYLLKSDMTNMDAIKLLRSGSQTPLNITFNNARLKEDLAEKLCSNIAADKDKFLALLNDTAVISTYGFTPYTIKSMFIPNTYEVYWTITEEELLDKMKLEYDKFWNEERLAKAKAINMTPEEVSTLASIVEAESKMRDEQPRVAGVYINRLNRGMALQADPTLVFAAGDFTITRVLNNHKEIDSPYNTYKYAGLPPGPISIPSISAIDAVLNFESHKYLYFCAKEDFSGYHNFATNLTQHLNNARRYQQALNRAKIFQ